MCCVHTPRQVSFHHHYPRSALFYLSHPNPSGDHILLSVSMGFFFASSFTFSPAPNARLMFSRLSHAQHVMICFFKADPPSTACMHIILYLSIRVPMGNWAAAKLPKPITRGWKQPGFSALNATAIIHLQSIYGGGGPPLCNCIFLYKLHILEIKHILSREEA